MPEEEGFVLSFETVEAGLELMDTPAAVSGEAGNTVTGSEELFKATTVENGGIDFC